MSNLVLKVFSLSNMAAAGERAQTNAKFITTLKHFAVLVKFPKLHL